MSPAGTDPYDEKTWDPYKMKDSNDLRQVMKRDKVDKVMAGLEAKRHPLADLHFYPRWITRAPTKWFTDSMLRDNIYSEVVKAYAFEYFWCMAERPSVIDIA